jgi:hypothetical protein
VEPSPLEKISGIIFDLGNDGKIPEGDYLNLMNSMKKLYDEMKKPVAQPQPQIRVYRPAPPIEWEYNEDTNQVIINGDMPNYHRVIMTRHYETKLYILRRIEMEIVEGNRKLFFKEKGLSLVRRGLLNMTLRVFSVGKTYKFMTITKINDKSIKYCIKYITHDGKGRINRNCKLTFKNGEYYENFCEYATKQILIYNTTATACDELLRDFRIEWENAEVDNTLSIWN